MADMLQYPNPGHAIISNDWSLLIRKIIRKLQLSILVPHFPESIQVDKWIEPIKEDSLVTFSRFFPNKFPMVVTDETCYKKYDRQNRLWYIIKDEILKDAKLLGVKDIDFSDVSSNNAALGASSTTGWYMPSIGCPIGTFMDILQLQMAADFNSLYNRGIYIEFKDPNSFCLKGIGNLNYDLNSFTVILEIQHSNLSTISPTKMETFEKLATSDVANFLLSNLKYFDNLETVYVNLDLKIQLLEEWANKRDSIVEELDVAHVSTANELCPIIMTV